MKIEGRGYIATGTVVRFCFLVTFRAVLFFFYHLSVHLNSSILYFVDELSKTKLKLDEEMQKPTDPKNN